MMRPDSLWIALVLAAAIALSNGAALADEDKSDKDGGGAAQEESAEVAASPLEQPIMIAAMPVFVPPNRGSPLTRLGGATRGTGDGLQIEALVPEEAGWTLREQPALYWYLSEPTKDRVEFVLMRLDPVENLVETTLPAPEKAGVQRIDLAQHGVKLEKGVNYQWLVKLVPDPTDRSADKVVGGGLERVDASPELTAELAAASSQRQPHVLAKAGIWYDAIDQISVKIDAAPGDRQLWNQRAALFEQVGLPEVKLDDSAAEGFGRR